MRIAVACALIMVAPALAEARRLDQTYAELSRVPERDVVEVEAFELDGGPFTHILIGRFKRARYVHASVVLLHCDAKSCKGPTTSLGMTSADDVRASKAELVAIVDLAGKPTAFRGSLRGTSTKPLATAKLAWPALVVRFSEEHKETGPSRYGGEVSGVARHGELAILSLAPADATSPLMFKGSTEDRSASGAGTVTTYELVASAAPRPGKALDVRGMVQWKIEDRSRCLEPDPVPVVHALVDKDGRRRYEPLGGPPVKGC